MSDLCSHQQDQPEGTEWPADVALDHFLHCLTPDRQLEVWRDICQSADAGTRCVLENHRGVIQSQARYTAKLLTGIREIIDTQGLTAPRVTNKLQDLIS